MRRWLKLLVILAVIGGGIAAGYGPAMKYWKQRTAPKWKTEKVDRGDVIFEVNSTGTVKPVLSVIVGSFVSGPIDQCLVDFNDEVKKGDLLATIDTRLYAANVARDEASLATRQAEVARVKAQLQQAINDFKRAEKLRAINKDYLSDTEMDQYRFNRMALEAQLKVAEKGVETAKATLANSRANLEYCEIRSPVDGVIVDRKIDPGQTLAAAFQTPELFVVAPDLRKEVHIFAEVDETDIGRIRDAAEREQPVRFQVDAYPEEIFVGKIQQIRLSSAETQNVVTYPVVVSASNAELKLLPGMTATLSFQIEHKKDVVRIPNSALRFYPEKEWVRPEDQPLLEGRSSSNSNDEETDDSQFSVTERVTAYRKRHKRHVWVKDGDKLRAIEVRVGISDHRYTEVTDGKIKPGDQLVVGRETK